MINPMLAKPLDLAAEILKAEEIKQEDLRRRNQGAEKTTLARFVSRRSRRQRSSLLLATPENSAPSPTRSALAGGATFH
jgi:hypothetical protein